MGKDYNKEIAEFRQRLKASAGTAAVVAKLTAEFFRSVISQVSSRVDILSLLTTLRQVAKQICEEQEHAMIISNVARRVLYILREEHENTIRESTPQLSPPTFEQELSSGGSTEFSRTLSTVNPTLTGALLAMPGTVPRTPLDTMWSGPWKQNAMRHLNEFLEELESSTKNICDYAKDHISDRAVILTHGKSSTVERFLTAAAKKKNFEVIVTEDAPSLSGREMAKQLSQGGVKVTVIPDSAVFAIMSRVTEVLVGTRAVLANGGLVTRSGVHVVAVAAKEHSVPFVVCTGLFKLTPVYPYDTATQFSTSGSPADVLPYEFLIATAGNGGVNQLHVKNPSSDYIPPDLVHTYITNSGIQSPSYIYRLLVEMYNPDDYDLD
eukprot:TRINITY_DN8909_c0_g1_i1.p1 TRINITY_DN8909_c0_g1~~TRINITY_DN8909_c0_g1_i1.p1  ORF type:complete len:387 (-),score=58.27 TRINITY_DN8909_c0_g1_i1:18-1157(-)